MERRKAAINPSIDKSVIISRCIALIVIHMNMHTYTSIFVTNFFFLDIKGSAEIDTGINGYSFAYTDDGKFSILYSIALALNLKQHLHRCMMLRTWFRPSISQKIFV